MFISHRATLGTSALKVTVSAKRKESSHSSESKDKKKKSALDEIMEACFPVSFLAHFTILIKFKDNFCLDGIGFRLGFIGYSSLN